MDREELNLQREVVSRLKQHEVYKKLNSFGSPVFLTISGSHSFGFPSANSDYDIRGVYIAPTENFLGLRKHPYEKTFQFMDSNKILDVSVDEIGQFINVALGRSGNRFEWINNNLIFYLSNEFEELRDVVNQGGISKKLSRYYIPFARNMWQGKTKEEGLKKDLYALRAYMVGINLFETGQVIPDITELNKRFGYDLVNNMIELKKHDEFASREGYDKAELSSIISALDERILASVESSSLPEEPNIKLLNDFLKKIRRRIL